MGGCFSRKMAKVVRTSTTDQQSDAAPSNPLNPDTCKSTQPQKPAPTLALTNIKPVTIVKRGAPYPQPDPLQSKHHTNESTSHPSEDSHSDVHIDSCTRRRSVKETTAMFEVLECTQDTPPVTPNIHTQGTVSPKLLSLTSKLESISLTETGTFLPTATVATVESSPARSILRRSTTAGKTDASERTSIDGSLKDHDDKMTTKGSSEDDASSQDNDSRSESNHAPPDALLRPRSVKESTELFEVLDKTQIVSPRTFVVSHDDLAAARVHDFTSKFQKGASTECVTIMPTAPIATVEAKCTNDIVRTTSDVDRRDDLSDGSGTKRSLFGRTEMKDMSNDLSSISLSSPSHTKLVESGHTSFVSGITNQL